jgi:hypothetical protein
MTDTPGPLTFVETEALVTELLSRHQAVIIGVVKEDEDVPHGCMAVMYRTAGEPSLQLCCVRDLRYLVIDKALQAGMSVDRIEEIFSMYGKPPSEEQAPEPLDGPSDD